MHGINCPFRQFLFEPMIITRGSGYNRGLRFNRGTTGPPGLCRSALFLVCRGSGSGRGTKVSLCFNTDYLLNKLFQNKGWYCVQKNARIYPSENIYFNFNAFKYRRGKLGGDILLAHCSRSVSKIDLRSQQKFQWDMNFWGKSFQKIKKSKKSAEGT